MGQGQGKAQGQRGATSVIRSVLRNGPTPFSDALVQQQAGSERHVTSRRDTANRVTAEARPLDSSSPPPRSESTGAAAGGDRVTPGAEPSRESPQPAAVLGAKKSDTLPVVIRFTPQKPSVYPGGGTSRGTPAPTPEVMLLLESRDWEPIPMSASGEDFFAVIGLSKGEQAFKFTVDGQEVLDPNQPQRASGVPANVVNVKEAVMSTKEDDDPVDDPSGWGQEQVMFEETKKMPPILPPHLRYTPLNTPPTQYRQDAQGNFGAADDRSAVVDPEHLPLPLSVTINHVYFQRREDHTVLGVTTRYRSKFATVVYYKGGKEADA